LKVFASTREHQPNITKGPRDLIIFLVFPSNKTCEYLEEAKKKFRSSTRHLDNGLTEIKMTFEIKTCGHDNTHQLEALDDKKYDKDVVIVASFQALIAGWLAAVILNPISSELWTIHAKYQIIKFVDNSSVSLGAVCRIVGTKVVKSLNESRKKREPYTEYISE